MSDQKKIVRKDLKLILQLDDAFNYSKTNEVKIIRDKLYAKQTLSSQLGKKYLGTLTSMIDGDYDGGCILCGKDSVSNSVFCSECYDKSKIVIQRSEETTKKLVVNNPTNDVEMTKCPKCGSSILKNSIFCSFCGKKLVGSSDRNANIIGAVATIIVVLAVLAFLLKPYILSNKKNDKSESNANATTEMIALNDTTSQDADASEKETETGAEKEVSRDGSRSNPYNIGDTTKIHFFGYTIQALGDAEAKVVDYDGKTLCVEYSNIEFGTGNPLFFTNSFNTSSATDMPTEINNIIYVYQCDDPSTFSVFDDDADYLYSNKTITVAKGKTKKVKYNFGKHKYAAIVWYLRDSDDGESDFFDPPNEGRDGLKGFISFYKLSNSSKKDTSPKLTREEIFSQIDLKITNKKVLPKNYDLGRYSEFIELDYKVKNGTNKDIKGIKGTLEIYDQFEEHIMSLGWDVSEGIIKKGKSITVTNYGIEYNQFMDDHNKLYSTSYDDLIFKYRVQQINFSDGQKVKM